VKPGVLTPFQASDAVIISGTGLSDTFQKAQNRVGFKRSQLQASFHTISTAGRIAEGVLHVCGTKCKRKCVGRKRLLNSGISLCFRASNRVA
jgi:hypothetical protein